MMAVLSLCGISLSAFGIGEKIVVGNGKVEMRSFDEKDFTKVELSGNMSAEIVYGIRFGIKISTDENLYEYLSVDKIQDTLKIRTKNKVIIKKSTECNITITMPAIDECIVYGGCTAAINNFDDTDGKFILSHSGSSTITVNSLFKNIKAVQYGTGTFLLTGKAETLRYSSSGIAELYASELQAENVYLSWAGSGYAEVYATEKLGIDISGSGSIKYRGKPEIERSIRGSVAVTRIK